jgi:hypothetical protein
VSSTISPSPSCSYSSIPKRFYLQEPGHSYLKVNLTTNRVSSVSGNEEATVFHVRSTNDGSITGIQQLAFNVTSSDSTNAVEYGAYIQTSTVDDANPIVFFNETDRPSSGYGIVTAGFSTYLCQLSLITWMFHDLSYIEYCGEVLSLGYGLQDSDRCHGGRLLVTAA